MLGFLIAIWIEYMAVYLLHKWEYSELMPVIFGIGLSPLVQLTTTGLMTIYFLRKFIL